MQHRALAGHFTALTKSLKNETCSSTQPLPHAHVTEVQASMPQLLGIMASLHDTWMLSDWLHRHHAMFERLVLVDASVRPGAKRYTRDLCAEYAPVCVHMPQPPLPVVTDQTVRAVAMQVLGNPVGRWVLLAHADEFFIQDPRAHADLPWNRTAAC